MQVEFEKWHGNLNDFILCWLPEDDIVLKALQKAAPKLCSRDGSSIGADGILLMETTQASLNAKRLRIINSDGSLAETCGNGIRCAALSTLKRYYEYERAIDIPDAFELELENSSVLIRFLSKEALEKKKPKWPLVSVDMGIAKLDGQIQEFEAISSYVNKQLEGLSQSVLKSSWHMVDIGNQHLIFFVEKLEKKLLYELGSHFQTSDFWDGINVHLAMETSFDPKEQRRSQEKLGQSIDAHYEALVWERGVGPTAACGSGACAIIKAAQEKDMLDRNEWTACRMPGGYLYIKQESNQDPMELAGPAEFSFFGQFEL